MKRLAILSGLAALVWGWSAVNAQTPFQESPEDKKAPLKVSADRMIADNKNNVISFMGSVVALKGSLKVTSEAMRARTSEDQKTFTSIEAEGNVKIYHKEKIATGERAHYSDEKRMIVLTGDVTLEEGKNIAKGDRAVYYLDTEEMILMGKSAVKGEPSTGERATITLYPESPSPLPHEPPSKSPFPIKQTQSDAWSVQVGSFSNPDRAQALFDDLKKKGYDVIQEKVAAGDKTATKIRVGAFPTHEEAEAYAKKLTKKEGLEAIVVQSGDGSIEGR